MHENLLCSFPGVGEGDAVFGILDGIAWLVEYA